MIEKCGKPISPLDGDSTTNFGTFRNRYLPHLIEEMEMLTLPGGHKVPLGQLYVSLRADAMNAGECQAEHMAFLDAIEEMTTAHGLNMADPLLRDSVAREEAEAVLRATVLSEEMEQHLAVITIIH